MKNCMHNSLPPNSAKIIFRLHFVTLCLTHSIIQLRLFCKIKFLFADVFSLMENITHWYSDKTIIEPVHVMRPCPHTKIHVCSIQEDYRTKYSSERFFSLCFVKHWLSVNNHIYVSNTHCCRLWASSCVCVFVPTWVVLFAPAWVVLLFRFSANLKFIFSCAIFSPCYLSFSFFPFSFFFPLSSPLSALLILLFSIFRFSMNTHTVVFYMHFFYRYLPSR